MRDRNHLAMMVGGNAGHNNYDGNHALSDRLLELAAVSSVRLRTVCSGSAAQRNARRRRRAIRTLRGMSRRRSCPTERSRRRMRTGTSSSGPLTSAPADEGVRGSTIPKGTVIEFTMNSSDSKIYPGIARDAEYIRNGGSCRPREAGRDHKPSCSVHAQGDGLRSEAVRRGQRRAVHRGRGRA